MATQMWCDCCCRLEAVLGFDNATVNKGWTSLHVAVENGHLEIVDLLLEVGASCDLPTKDHGLTPLHWLLRMVTRKWLGCCWRPEPLVTRLVTTLVRFHCICLQRTGT